MRFLLVARDYFPPRVGGISRMMEQLSIELGPQNICVLTQWNDGEGSNNNNARLSFLETPTGPVYVYRRPTVFDGGRARALPALVATATEIAIRHRPQGILFATCNEAYLALAMRGVLDMPFAIFAHGNELLEQRAAKWDKPLRALREANAVIANSEYTAAILRDLRVKNDAIRIVAPGCDAERFKPESPPASLRDSLFGKNDNAFVILSVGHLVARKGHDLLIRATARLAQEIPQLRYVIVGSGLVEKELRQLAVDEKIADRVIFTGRVSDEALPQYYNLCDVFAMPSRVRDSQNDTEGFGIVFLEANACGKPVIGGRSGGVSDAVADGVTGLLVDPESVEDTAEAIRRLHRDPALRNALGAAGRAKVVSSRTWHHFADHVKEIAVERFAKSSS